MHQIFTQIYSTVSTGPLYMGSPTGFSEVSPLKSCFPTFHYGTSSFCCLHIFLHENPTSPSNRHKISVGPEKPPHLLFLKIQNSLFGDFFPTLEPPLPSTPWCCSLNRIRASTQLFIKNFFFYDHPIYMQDQRTPPPILQNKSRRHTLISAVSALLSTIQITTSKINWSPQAGFFIAAILAKIYETNFSVIVK